MSLETHCLYVGIMSRVIVMHLCGGEPLEARLGKCCEEKGAHMHTLESLLYISLKHDRHDTEAHACY